MGELVTVVVRSAHVAHRRPRTAPASRIEPASPRALASSPDALGPTYWPLRHHATPVTAERRPRPTTGSQSDGDDRSPTGPDQLRGVLGPPPTRLDAGPRAAVAAVFRAGSADAELLFIQRATHDGDPWSGQMAFPGGRAEPTDADSFATAERETREEIGLDLDRATRVGSLGDVDGGRAARRFVAVSAHCYWLPGPRPTVTPNYEVADVVWVGLDQLGDRSRWIDYWYPPAEATFPGVQLDRDDQVVWGLTLRLLADLFDRLDRPFLLRPER